MKNSFSLVLCMVLTLGFLCSPVSALPASEVIDGIVAFNEPSGELQAWANSALAENAGSSEWYLFALRRLRPELDFTAYTTALLSYTGDRHISAAATRQKYALALTACGQVSNAFVTEAAEQTVGAQGIMSWVFGLHLLNNGVSCSTYGIGDITDKLLSLRTEDGGWALSGKKADVDVTAMTVQALAPLYGTDAVVREAVDEAIDLLGSLQLDNGGFTGFGSENSESCSQVIIALTSVGINPDSDPRFNKSGNTLTEALMTFRTEDGGFSHTRDGRYNATATAQAFCAFVSLGFIGDEPLYVFTSPPAPVTDQVTEAPGTEPAPDTPSVETDVTTEPLPVIGGGTGYKLWVCIAIAAAAVIAALIFLLCGKRNPKNFIFIASVGAILTAVTLLTDISTPENYYTPVTGKANTVGEVTYTIRCDTVAGKGDNSYIPDDGVILPEVTVAIDADDTVYDILTEIAKTYRIQLEIDGAGELVYLRGIGYLYEFDFGDLSGWNYRVNGEVPSVGCGGYILSDGDSVEWLYTCDSGNDLD